MSVEIEDLLLPKVEAENIKLHNRPIAYISCPITLQDTSSFDYFVSIIDFLVEDMNDLLDRELIIKVSSGKSKKEQLELIQEVFDDSDLYSAIVIAPESAKQLKKYFSDNQSKLKEIINNGVPIFTIDKKIAKLDGGFQIPFITANWSYGGKLAAMAYARLLIGLDKPKNKVFIVRGQEGSESRIRGFKKYLKDEMPHVEIRETNKKLDYSRESAFDHLFENKSDYQLKDYDLIYCCNDEMALGVREFLMMENISVNNTRIIGFDSTIEFKWLAKYPTNHLYKSVDVQLRRQVRQLVKFLSEFDKEVFYQNPKGYCHIEKVKL